MSRGRNCSKLRAATINAGNDKSLISVAVGICTAVVFTSALPAPADAQWYWRHPQPQGNNLRAVDFTDALHGTVVGDYGTILTTTDGGRTWLRRESEAPQPNERFRDVLFADQANGLVAGRYFADGESHGLILGTTDGGATWVTRQTFPGVVGIHLITYEGDAPVYDITKKHLLRYVYACESA